VPNILNMATKPRWAWDAGHAAAPSSATSSAIQAAGDMSSLSEWTSKQFDPQLNWGDVEWNQERWGGS